MNHHGSAVPLHNEVQSLYTAPPVFPCVQVYTMDPACSSGLEEDDSFFARFENVCWKRGWHRWWTLIAALLRAEGLRGFHAEGRSWRVKDP